jgi:hypothetical protein
LIANTRSGITGVVAGECGTTERDWTDGRPDEQDGER